MTSKELAKILGLSESAVSFALNNKPGVSEETRQMVKKAALEHGMNLREKHRRVRNANRMIYVIDYSPRYTAETDFFTSTYSGIEFEAIEHGYHVTLQNVNGAEQLQQTLKRLEHDRISGIIFYGYLMDQTAFSLLSFCHLPMIVMDNHFLSTKIDFITVNNIDSAYLAANYLINKRHQQPGYLKSSIRTYDFDHRERGFYWALRHNGMPSSKSIVHELSSASIENAEADMIEILNRREELAGSYFADSDMIAIGAIRALKSHGYRIPEDISIIGFDDISVASYIEPPLTTVHIPRHYMGKIAVDRLINVIKTDEHHTVNIQIDGYIQSRGSIAPISAT